MSLIEDHHLAGRDVIIVSTSGSEVVEPIGEMLGADRVVATQMEIEDGKYTGGITFYAYAEAKAEEVRKLAEAHGYDLERCYAYSDSVTDVHMLEAVGHPYAVNPDKDLRRIARDRGWPILVFAKPVALRRRVKLPPAKPTLATLTVGGFAAIGAAMWLGARRRRLRRLDGPHRLEKSSLVMPGNRRRQESTTQSHTQDRYPRGDLPFLQGVGLQPGTAGGHSWICARLVARILCVERHRESAGFLHFPVPLTCVGGFPVRLVAWASAAYSSHACMPARPPSR